MIRHERYGKHPNLHLARIIKNAGGSLPKVKVRERLTETEAFETEIALIKAIGRADLGQGPLVNLTDGGEGAKGKSADARARLSAAAKKKIGSLNPFFGKEHSEVAKEANRLAHIGKPSPLKGIKGADHHWFGRKHSPDTIQKMKVSSPRKGIKLSKEERCAISERTKAAMANPAVRARMRASSRARWDRHI